MSKELTEAWKSGKLKNGWYFIKFTDEIYPDYYNGYFIQTGDKEGMEVLAPVPDYNEMRRLKEENNDLSALITGDELENEQLRAILKECRKHLQVAVYNPETDTVYDNIANLLTNINAILGESEEQ